jgi:hypothetical protein
VAANECEEEEEGGEGEKKGENEGKPFFPFGCTRCRSMRRSGNHVRRIRPSAFETPAAHTRPSSAACVCVCVTCVCVTCVCV